MQIYNAIIVLKEILPFYPMAKVTPTTGPKIEEALETFLEDEERGDLKILGTS